MLFEFLLKIPNNYIRRDYLPAMGTPMKTATGRSRNETGFEPLDEGLVRSMVARVQDILPLPNIVNAILKNVNDPYASLGKVAETILKDQALTAKVLKVINSAYYGIKTPVATVSQAVSLLGLEKIKNLAMAISLAEGLYRFSGLPFGRGALWHHSQACGVATSLVAEAAGYPNPEETLIAGLLHDIAKALWTELFPERFLAAIKAVQVEGRDPLEVETAYLTVPHTQVGAWMLEKWQLPGIFQKAVARHHDPLAADGDPDVVLLSYALCLGNIMAKLLNLGEGGNYRLGALPPDLFKALGLSRSQVAERLRALPRAFFDFVEELKLEGAKNARLDTLAAWLQEREVALLMEDKEGEPGPGALFFQAFAGQVRILPVANRADLSPGNASLFFWEGDAPGGILSLLEGGGFSGPLPPVLLFRHRACLPWTEVNLSGVHLLGPEWRLEDIAKAVNPEARN